MFEGTSMSLPMLFCTIIVLIGIFIGAIMIAQSVTKKMRGDGNNGAGSDVNADAGSSDAGTGKGSGAEAGSSSAGNGRKYHADGDTTMGDLLDHSPAVAIVLAEMGMHCIGCPSHQNETLEQAAAVHGIDTAELVNAVNSFLDSNEQEQRSAAEAFVKKNGPQEQ